MAKLFSTTILVALIGVLAGEALAQMIPPCPRPMKCWDQLGSDGKMHRFCVGSCAGR